MNKREIALYLKIKGEPDEETDRLISELYPVAERTPSALVEGRFSLVRVEDGGASATPTSFCAATSPAGTSTGVRNCSSSS